MPTSPEPTPEDARAEVARVMGTASDREPLSAAAELLPLVYDELRRLAAHRLAGERRHGAGHVLQPTALVHESYLRLVGQGSGATVTWNGRAHFFGAAARAMRRILVEHSRRRRTEPRTNFDDLPSTREFGQVGGRLIDVEDLDRALDALELRDKRKHDVITLRFFAGRTVEEVAELLDSSPRTVKRDFSFGRAWLLKWIEDQLT